MRRFVFATVLLSFVTSGYGKDPALVPATILGSWVVQDVFCQDCGERRPAEIGTEIQIGKTVVRNPLGGDCQDSPEYQAIRSSSWQEVADRAGISPAQADSIADAQKMVTEGSITCSGLAYLPVVAINEALALYPFDGGLTFLLARKSSAAKADPRIRSNSRELRPAPSGSKISSQAHKFPVRSMLGGRMVGAGPIGSRGA